jgi:tetratricopeptide (TPR) repeat protein
MNRKAIVLVAAVLLLAAGLSGGQQEKLPPQEAERIQLNVILEQQGNTQRQAAANQKAFDLRMYEDIEIMRRILAGKIRNLTGSGMTSNQGKGQTAAFFDLERDGDLDVVVANKGMGVALGDFDSDGFVDLFITNATGHGKLYLNKGEGTFVEATLAETAAQAHQDVHGLAAANPIEGCYLKGHGVVYSLSLPILSEQLARPPAKPAPKALSQWERVRKELRGEKADSADKPAQNKQETLADALLKLLAENGRNFSQLPANESLTVAITLNTLRNQDSCLSCHTLPWKQETAGSPKKMGTRAGVGGDANGGVNKTGAAGGSNGGSSTTATVMALRALGTQAASDAAVHKGVEFLQRRETESLESDAQNNALLGDLHMKQGRFKDAADAYQKAVETYQKALNKLTASKRPAAEVRGYLTAVEYLSKLAQSQSAAGDPNGAVKSLKELANYSRAVEQRVTQAQLQQVESELTGVISNLNAAVSALPLPSKLIVSVSKKQLDQVAAGKISFEDLKKGASVQYLTFAAPKANPPATGGGTNAKPTSGDNVQK